MKQAFFFVLLIAISTLIGGCAAVRVSAITTPVVTRIGSKYSFRFDVSNKGSEDITVSSVSSETYLNGVLLRTNPHFFSPQSHGNFWNPAPIAPGETVTIYQAFGVRTATGECGHHHAKLTFHTNAGDYDTTVDYEVAC